MVRRLMTCAAGAVLIFSASGCGGGESTEDASSDDPTSKKASPKPSAPRVEGDYDTGNGFTITIKPTCDSGPCDVVVSYDYPRGSKGQGRLKYDGKSYDGDVKDTTGCMVNFVFGRPAAVGKVHYHFTVVGTGEVAQQITGTRGGKYHLVGKYKKSPGCLPQLPPKPFQGTLVG